MTTTLKKPQKGLDGHGEGVWRVRARDIKNGCHFWGERGRLLFGLACYEIVISVRVRSTAGQNRVRDMDTEYIGIDRFFLHMYTCMHVHYRCMQTAGITRYEDEEDEGKKILCYQTLPVALCDEVKSCIYPISA